MGSINSIPVISQLKSLVQVIGGDAAGAKKTQEQFVRTGIIASQVNSYIQAVRGNDVEARAIQNDFLSNAESIVNGIPVVGHLKGAIHILANDKERGLKIIEGKNKTVKN